MASADAFLLDDLDQEQIAWALTCHFLRCQPQIVPWSFVVGADVTCVGPMVLVGACRSWQKGRVVVCDRKDQSPRSCRE